MVDTIKALLAFVNSSILDGQALFKIYFPVLVNTIINPVTKF